MRIYAIGDIHGQLDKLKDVHDRIARDRARTGVPRAPVVHLGDLVDRGPDSKWVIEYLIRGIERHEPWIVLKGNHDQGFANQLGLPQTRELPYRTWISGPWGGRETVMSYGIDPDHGTFWRSEARVRDALRKAVPEEHRRFLQGLPLHHATDDAIFVHAGLRPGLELSEQIEDDLMWIRGEFLNDPRDHGRLVVHGHTPVDLPTHYGNRVNVDTGAGYGRALTVIVLEGRDVWVLDDAAERVPLLPGESGTSGGPAPDW